MCIRDRNDSMTFSVLLLLFSVFISAVSQILLKKAAQKHYPNRLKEYLNPWVITAYSIFLLSTVLTMLALRTCLLYTSVGANSKNAMVPLTTMNTKNILFICGGAFPGLEDIIKERLNKQASIGFQADLKDKYDADPNLLEKVTLDDIRNFGMIPEFIGRLPIIFTLRGLDEEMLVKILKLSLIHI